MATARELYEAGQQIERRIRSLALYRLEWHQSQLAEGPRFSHVRRLARRGIRLDERAVRSSGELLLAAGDFFYAFVLDGGGRLQRRQRGRGRGRSVRCGTFVDAQPTRKAM